MMLMSNSFKVCHNYLIVFFNVNKRGTNSLFYVALQNRRRVWIQLCKMLLFVAQNKVFNIKVVLGKQISGLSLCKA